LVSPEAATDGVTPFVSEKQLTPFLVIALCKVMRTFFTCRLVTTPTFLRRLSSVFFCSF